MNLREILLKMRKWVEAEIEKAQKPYAEKFTLTSLAYCAEKVASAAEAQEALELLRSTAAANRQVGTYDVVGPYTAIFLINRALATINDALAA